MKPELAQARLAVHTVRQGLVSCLAAWNAEGLPQAPHAEREAEPHGVRLSVGVARELAVDGHGVQRGAGLERLRFEDDALAIGAHRGLRDAARPLMRRRRTKEVLQGPFGIQPPERAVQYTARDRAGSLRIEGPSIDRRRLCN